jgi:hypothetical protein
VKNMKEKRGGRKIRRRDAGRGQRMTLGVE